MNNIKIIRAQDEHFPDIWNIFNEVVKNGDSYVYSPDTTKEQVYDIWMKQPYVYIALINDEIAGSYIMKPNFPDLGSHVANCSYMVNSKFRGMGIGKFMGEHSLKTAKEVGFVAMQFNIVVSTNHAAVKLWHLLGFKIMATIPQAFKHKDLGYVDTYVMHRFLT